MAFAEVAEAKKVTETVKTAAEISVAEKMKHLPQNIAKFAAAKAGEKAVKGVIGNDPDLAEIRETVTKIRNIIHIDIKAEKKKEALNAFVGEDQDLKEIIDTISDTKSVVSSSSIESVQSDESNAESISQVPNLDKQETSNQGDTASNESPERGHVLEEVSNESIQLEDNSDANNTSSIIDDKPSQETIDGKTYYYDDNGNVYRVDNVLLPNTVYEVNGYKYTTDDQGRIISAEGKLRLRDADYKRKMENVKNYENQEYLETDDRGHLIAHRFGGSDRLENIIPQDSEINQNDFRNFEGELAKEVKNGKEVIVKVEPIYEGDSRRPVAIVVTYSIDGEESVRVFPNGQEE